MIETRYNRNDTMKKIGDIVIEHDTMSNMIHDLKEILQAHGLSETPDRKDLLMDAYLAGVLYGRSVKAHWNQEKITELRQDRKTAVFLHF